MLTVSLDGAMEREMVSAIYPCWRRRRATTDRCGAAVELLTSGQFILINILFYFLKTLLGR